MDSEDTALVLCIALALAFFAAITIFAVPPKQTVENQIPAEVCNE